MDDTYEYGNEYPDYEVGNKHGLNAGFYFLVFLIFVFYAAFNFLLIVVILSKAELRRHTGNWLLITMSVCMIIEAIMFVTSTSNNMFGIPTWTGIYELCAFMNIFGEIVFYTTPLIILLITVERYVCIVRGDMKTSGLSKGATIGSIVGIFIANTILTCILTFAFGDGVVMYTGGGLQFCFISRNRIASLCMSIFNLIIVIVIIVIDRH